jgi:signal transduction histidine kinase
MAATRERSAYLLWLGAAGALAAGWVVVCSTLNLMVDRPAPLGPWLGAALLFIPLAYALGRLVRSPRVAGMVFVESMAASGIAALAAVAYLVFVVGMDGTPTGHERDVLVSSLVAATAVAVLAVPVRQRLVATASRIVADQHASTDEVATSFSARMSRAVPMDELMLQLAESLRASIARGGAEIWTGSDSTFTRTVSVPSAPAERIELGEHERIVVSRARIGGPSWTAVWLPRLATGAADMRVVPIAHLGELHGFVVVRRREDEQPFSDDDEQPLVELARQLGLALHNVRLDSALQASLAELAERNEELQASRLRIVTAADASRREIERNLHDGAQQHLVALAVKLGLAGQIAEDGDTTTVLEMLEALRGDVQTTIGELRELAHGIYPPLLRDRGLAEALRTAANRCSLPTTVDVDLPGRYAEPVETAAYFCCLEAMQNAGKYAGEGATLSVDVRGDEASLSFELVDDGVGFETSTTDSGHGFVNMQDRLGAIGGELTIESAPGKGTTVRAIIPATPRSARGEHLA